MNFEVKGINKSTKELTNKNDKSVCYLPICRSEMDVEAEDRSTHGKKKQEI